MIDIPVVQTDALVPVDGSASVHLRPPGDARPYGEHLPLVGGVLGKRPGMVGEGRPWADKAHIAFEDIDALRQLIQRKSAKDPARPRDAGIVIVAVDAAPRMLRTHGHGSKLVESKHFLVQPDTLLTKERASLGIQADQEHDEKEKRG